MSCSDTPVLVPSLPTHASRLSVPAPRHPPPSAPAPRVAAYGSKIITLSWKKRLRQAPSSAADPLVVDYNRTFFGVDDPATRPSVCEYFASKPALVSDFLALSDLFGPCPLPPLEWKAQLPSHAALLRTPFGRPSPSASFTQTACFETAVFNVFKSGLLDLPSFDTLCACHPLLHHMARLIPALAPYDFTWLRDYDSDWESYSTVPPRREMAFLALVFHYDLHLSAAVRYLGERFTGSYRDADTICELLAQHHIPPDLIAHFRRVITHGGPAHLNTEVSRANTLLYWREGNATSILQHEDTVRQTMAKEMRNAFCFPLPSWTTRFMKHIFLTPLHILLKDDKARMIFNAKLRHNEDAVSLNMMTSTHLGVELDCEYGTVYQRIFERIYNLRISYPDEDLVIHANDIKSCFRQIKHHPDVVGGFCYTLFEHLWVQVGLTFGSDFSPQNWEPCRRVLELLAQSLFHDTSLRDKHRKYLDRILWSDSLTSRKARRRFVQAFRDSKNPGVLDEDGRPTATPHHVFVDDGIYADAYDVVRIEQALAASIEAIFIILGESDLTKRQDPISFDKMCELLVAPFNKILGLLFDLRKLTVGPPPEFVAKTVARLDAFHDGRRSFQVQEMSELLGMLQHIANSSRWLNHLLSHLYTSLGAALGCNKAHLLNTRKEFREALKLISSPSSSPSRRSFAHSTTARQIHSSTRRYFLNTTAKEELRLIRAALRDDTIPKYSPIAFLIPRDPSGTAWGDSCLSAAGGYSIDMQFWWYLEWPPQVVKYTLLFMRNNPDKGKLISINALEYATVIINYCAALLYFQELTPRVDAHPTVHIKADNTTAESWASSGCKRGLLMGRALGRLQCALMLRNCLGLTMGHVTTKDNWIADEISRIKQELDSLTTFCSLISQFPQLSGCRRYHPSAVVLSAVTDALLTQKMPDPLSLSQLLLSDLGSFTTCASVQH